MRLSDGTLYRMKMPLTSIARLMVGNVASRHLTRATEPPYVETHPIVLLARGEKADFPIIEAQNKE